MWSAADHETLSLSLAVAESHQLLDPLVQGSVRPLTDVTLWHHEEGTLERTQMLSGSWALERDAASRLHGPAPPSRISCQTLSGCAVDTWTPTAFNSGQGQR